MTRDQKAAGQATRTQQDIEAARDAYVAGRDQIFNIAVSATQPAVPALLPRDVPGFTGRGSELERLTARTGGGSVVVTAIGGTAGVGKTALAVHAAYRLLPGFPGGHLYADLQGYTEGQAATEPNEILDLFLRRLGVPAEELPAGMEERSGLLRHLLAHRPVLMVLDNAATEAQVRPLLPGTGSSLVLITSRAALEGLELDERIDLDVLSDGDATALLVELIGQHRATTEPDAVRQLAGWCGCLPLALRIAGQMLAARPRWPVSRLAAMLADERHRLDLLAAGDRQVRAAFEVSYRHLASQDARLFRFLGLHPGPDFDAAAAAALASLGPGAAEQVLDRLALAHLIIEASPGRFRIHDLLRLFARETCFAEDNNTARSQATAQLVDHFLELAAYLNGCLDPQFRPRQAEAANQAGQSLSEPRQVLVLFEAERRNILAAIALAVDQGRHKTVWQLSEDMGIPLTLLCHLGDLLTVRQTALNAARAVGDRTAEAAGLNNLGLAYAELWRFEDAITCYQDALTILRETGDRRNEGPTLTNLGSANQRLRRFEDAITFHKAALTIFQEIGDRHGEGQALDNLGITYDELRRFEDAITCHKAALTIFQEIGDRHGEGQALHNLGLTHTNLWGFKDAITCFQAALTIFQEIGDRRGEGQALNNLGLAHTHVYLWDSEDAITCFQAALTIFQEIGDRRGEAQTLDHLGTSYQKMRRFEDAITSYQDALAIFQEIGDLGGEGITLGNLGLIYTELRQFERAGTYWRRVSEAIREIDDPSTVAWLDVLIQTRSQPRRRRWWWHANPRQEAD